jgi:hypothetical protein
MYLPGRKRALTGKEMAELQEADSGPIQLENDAKHFVIQRFRLKTMLNSNSILQKASSRQDKVANEFFSQPLQSNDVIWLSSGLSEYRGRC